MKYRYMDLFGREREIELEEDHSALVSHGALLRHESGRLYRRDADVLKLVGTYRHPKAPQRRASRCEWVTHVVPMFFESEPHLGRIL